MAKDFYRIITNIFMVLNKRNKIQNLLNLKDKMVQDLEVAKFQS